MEEKILAERAKIYTKGLIGAIAYGLFLIVSGVLVFTLMDDVEGVGVLLVIGEFSLLLQHVIPFIRIHFQ